MGLSSRNKTMVSDKHPFFSLITVVFNDLAGLRQTQDSIIQQECADFEWIVIDGGSSDGTREYLEGLGTQAPKWMSEKDNGIYDAMNKGIRLAEGDYIVFMNAGDAFRAPATLKKVKDHVLDRSFGPDVIFGGSTLVLRNGSQIYRPPRDIDRYIWHGLPAYHQATYYKSGRIKALLYDTAYRICGDYYIAATLYKQGITASYLNMSLVNFRVGDTSYINPVKLVLEPYRIQKDILGCSLFRRSLSVAKRLVSLLSVVVLSQPFSRSIAGIIDTRKGRRRNEQR